MPDAFDDDDSKRTLPRRLARPFEVSDTVPMQPGSNPRRVTLEISVPPPTSSGAAERYELLAQLGEGGMGEVRLFRDRRIGREVAIKTIRAAMATRSDHIARFEREARVQGQLEHPAVVPVYDLGVDASGRAYFTMKRVRGRTLAEVLDRLAQGDRETAAAFSLRRLLTAFSQVCLAVDFAHVRGVLHRDIKPENIMLGDYGEVSLLDWGIATVVDDLSARRAQEKAGVVDAVIDDAHKTLAGEMVGSPGYMSPEQIRGDAGAVDERADVFALGAVLYEILTLEPLVPGESIVELTSRTMAGVDARARERAPGRDVPPELELACIRATAPLAERYESARELQRAVEHYLDGDRDLARRKELAAERVAHAERFAGTVAARIDDGARTEALRELSAAIALDPSNVRARELLGGMLLSMPEAMPADAREGLEERRRARRFALRKTLFLITLAFLAAPLSLLWLGVRDWRYFLVVSASSSLVPIAGFLLWRAPPGDKKGPIVLMTAAMLALATSSVVLGPLVQAPTIVLAVTVVWTALSARDVRLLALPLGALALMIPLALQLAGVLPASYDFADGTLRVLPVATELTEARTLSFMSVFAIVGLALATFVVARQQAQLERLEERLFLHVHTLQKLVPESARVLF